MLVFLPVFVRLPLAFLLFALNTIGHSAVLFVVALFKALLPLAPWRRACSRVLIALAESWIGINDFLLHLLTPTVLHIEGREGLRREGWYLVLSNHQSWVDIPVLQSTFNRRIPFLKFFLKRQLIWVPVLGLAWWALDFPFMQRYTKEQLERHPEWRGTDKLATRRACEKFRDLPVSVMNFVEGTRFTTDKHARQQSAYADLLRPKAGGVAFVLEAMGDILQSVVDVTIVYPGGRPTVIDLLAGRVGEVRLHVRELPIPSDLIGGDYEHDTAYRERFQAWLNALWAAKQARIDAMQRKDKNL
jgi:1-acyl-sn-glycerol-3-phosphate acyltransferase